MRRIVVAIALIVIVVPTCLGAYLKFSEPESRDRTVVTPASSIVAHGNSLPMLASAGANPDSNDAKARIEASLRARADTIADHLDISVSEVNTVIDVLGIGDWEATDLPDDAIALDTYPIAGADDDAAIVLYEDSSYVTVSTVDGETTLSVPKAARESLSLLGLLA